MPDRDFRLETEGLFALKQIVHAGTMSEYDAFHDALDVLRESENPAIRRAAAQLLPTAPEGRAA